MYKIFHSDFFSVDTLMDPLFFGRSLVQQPVSCVFVGFYIILRGDHINWYTPILSYWHIDEHKVRYIFYCKCFLMFIYIIC